MIQVDESGERRGGFIYHTPEQWMFGPPNSDYNLVDNPGLGGRAVEQSRG
jgi:hypothetical protein